MESTHGWIGGLGLPSCGGHGQRTQQEDRSLWLSPHLQGAKEKRLSGEAQNGVRGKESVQGKKAYASSGAEKGGKGRARRHGEEAPVLGVGEGRKPSFPRRKLWRHQCCGASSRGRTRGVGEREGDTDRRYLFCATSPVTARATLQACLCASFF